jgi:hypothetical protein
MHASLAMYALESACGRQSATQTSSPGPYHCRALGIALCPIARGDDYLGDRIDLIGPIVFEIATLSLDLG